MADGIEGMLQGKLGEKFEAAIEAKIRQFGGLLTRGAAVRLLCKENGIEAERKALLSEASNQPLPFSFSARVDRIFPVQHYKGGAGRMVRLHLSDRSGTATLALWNESAGLVEGAIRAGDTVECRGAYFRGGEISISKSGSIAVVEKAKSTPISKLSAGPNARNSGGLPQGAAPPAYDVEGTVSEAEPDYYYRDRKTGEEKSLSSFILCEGEDCRRVVVWHTDSARRVRAGDRLLLEGVQFRNGELHFGRQSRMVLQGSSSERKERIGSASLEGGMAAFHIGGKKFLLPIPEALALLGIAEVPPGVEPSTLFSIKASALEGKGATYREEGGRLAYLSVE